MAFYSIDDIAVSAMRAQSVRLDTIASNLANADSGASSEAAALRAVRGVFAPAHVALQAPGGVRAEGLRSRRLAITGIVRSDRTIARRLDARSAEADAEGYVYDSNVNVV